VLESGALSAALRKLIDLLDLEAIEENIFRGQNEANRGYSRLFGGQVAAQALSAAGRTVEGRVAHSLHAYFLRGGDPSIPIVFTVDRIRDGSSFTTRRVVAVQHGHAIFNMSVSFQKLEQGYSHQDAMPDAPDPESLPTWEERVREARDRIPTHMRSWMLAERPIEMRSLEPHSWFATEPSRSPNLVWLRASGELGDDPMLHQCLLAYASDMGFVDNIYRAHRSPGPRDVMMASLDHAMWFHRDFRMDDWLLYAQASPTAAGARGFAFGTLFSRGGSMVCSVAQEGLMRRIDPAKAAQAHAPPSRSRA
jgi:acyl-CoA thioesterase-2